MHGIIRARSQTRLSPALPSSNISDKKPAFLFSGRNGKCKVNLGAFHPSPSSEVVALAKVAFFRSYPSPSSEVVALAKVAFFRSFALLSKSKSNA